MRHFISVFCVMWLSRAVYLWCASVRVMRLIGTPACVLSAADCVIHVNIGLQQIQKMYDWLNGRMLFIKVVN